MAWFEAVEIAGYKKKEASQIIKKPNLNTKCYNIKALSSHDIEKKFLKRYKEIISEIS